MIISRIFQGLGNQLFQYAFGRAMAERNNTVLKLDTSFYGDAEVTQFGFTYKRNFELARYNVQLNEASLEEVARFSSDGKESLVNRIKQIIQPSSVPRTIKEDWKKFSPEFNSYKGDLYIDGYFTSEEFFKDYSELIRKEITLKNEMSQENIDWSKKMKSCNSVCISYRRTNFVNNPIHETCFMDYYINGLKKVQEMIDGDIEVFIWSDDNDWVQENFKPPYNCHYMTHNFPDFHEDLRLMTHCKHHVIPNSTFSWWAAWLGEHDNQIVIAPGRWLNSTEIEYKHVIPSRWVKIKN